MSTIVGVETDGGTVLAGDTVQTGGGTKVSDSVHRVFDFETAGAAAVGDPGDIAEFERQLQSETKQYRLEREKPMGIDTLARAAAGVAEAAGVDAIVSAYDDDSIARIRSIGRDGAVLDDETVAFGSGTELALGQLEDMDFEGDVDAVEGQVRDLFSTISERDVETGADLETWTLANENQN